MAASNKCFIIHTLWSRDVDVAMSHVPLHPAYQTTPLYSAQWRQYIVYDIWRQMRHWDIAMTSSDVFDVKWCSQCNNFLLFLLFFYLRAMECFPERRINALQGSNTRFIRPWRHHYRYICRWPDKEGGIREFIKYGRWMIKFVILPVVSNIQSFCNNKRNI